MSFTRRCLPVLLALICTAGVARAGELDRCRVQPKDQASGASLEAPATLGLSALDAPATSLIDVDEEIPLGDLRMAADFHPETDRWTERHNRIRISLWTAGWFFSGELDIHQDIAIGLRLAWEVPGFIGIRFDSGVVPWSRLEISPLGTNGNGRLTRWLEGFVHSHTLGIGIFNPELSVEGLAFWAGFGGGLWFYEYHESDIFGASTGIDGDFSDVNLSGHIFVELDYKIIDILHVSLGIREHVLLADHTDEGRFYEIDGVSQSFDSGRNGGILDDLAMVHEFTFSISVLF